ncbi:alpha-2-macroglobulin family protein [Brumimicrobium salinarum]|nr:MG2 domain-containing protein [Brumimicrobium salinarum]
MKIQHLLVLLSLIISFSALSQKENPLEKVDSLFKIRQPNAAQQKLWTIIETAKKNEDHSTLSKSFSYFNKFLAPLEMEERAALYFEVFKATQDLPQPSKSIAQLQMTQEVAYNFNSWFGYRQLQIYDSINIGDDIVRHGFVLNNIQALEKQLNTLRSYDFQPFQEVLTKENDSLFVLQTLSDYVAYQLINLYQSSIIESGGELKKSSTDHEQWYASSFDFTGLEFQNDNLTTKILKLYQIIEKNNKNVANYLSSSVYQRLHYLKNNFNNEKAIEQAWQEQFEYFKSTSARSKFLFEIAKSKYLKGKDYHFKRNPDVEQLIKEAHSQLIGELEKFPNSDFEYEIKALIQIVEQKNINISAPNIFSPNKKIPFLVKHRNMDQQVIRIYKVKDYTPLNNQNLRLIAADDHLTLVQTLTMDLKNKNRFQERSTELLLEEIQSVGKYYIVATNDDEPLAELAKDSKRWNAKEIYFTELTITEIRVSTTSANNEYAILVVDDKTNQPIENAAVKLFYYDRRKSNDLIEFESGKTDKNGLFTSSIKDKNRILYTVSHKNSLLHGNDYVRSSGEERILRRVELITDRSIYRPGQSVYFKGILYKGKDNEYEVIPGEKITLTIKDATRQNVFESNFRTNEFGSVDGSFQLPESTGLGNFQLIASGRGDYAYSSAQFSVEEYKRPTFEVKLNQPKNEAQLDDTVSISGNAKAFAGFPITNAKVSYSVYRNWNRYWRYYNQPSSGDLLKEGKVKTDENGKFTIDFFAESDPNAIQNAYYTYEIKAKVTDVSGETHEQTLSLNLSEIGVSIQVKTPGQFFTHNEEFAVIDIVNLAGEKQKDYNGTIKVYRKEYSDQFLNRIWENAEIQKFKNEELQTLFPNMNLNAFKEKSESEQLIKTISFQSGDSLKINDWINNQQGQYIFKFQALTKAGDTIKNQQQIVAIDVSAKELPFHNALWTFVSAKEVKVGKDIDFQIGSSFENAQALISVYRKDELLSREWVQLKDRHSLCYSVEEEDRGMLRFEAILFNNGVFYSQSENVNVPYSNKKLKIKTSTFRDLLEPGQKEQWSFTIQDENLELVKAELAATLYDASLDQFRGHNWNFFPYYKWSFYYGWNRAWTRGIQNKGSFGLGWELRQVLNRRNMRYEYRKVPHFSRIVDYHDQGFSQNRIARDVIAAAPENMQGEVAAEEEVIESDDKSGDSTVEKKKEKSEPINPRSNFNETAFFYPTIYSNDSNKYELNFTLPESLTKWKLLMLGHNKELQIGTFQKEIVAQKELMVTANAPRFVRQGDAIDFAAKVVNLTKEEQTVEVTLMLENPINQERLNLIGRQPLSKMVIIPAGESEEVIWNMNVGNQEVIQYTITAANESFSDGEQNSIPVLSNRILITETDHVLLREAGSSKHEFEAFKNQNSSTLENKSLTIEYTDNLAWNAVMALPYLTKENNKSVTALVNSYYANAIAKDIVNSHPQIQTIFNQWKSKSPDALLSELEKNKELKTILLEETPWVMDAKNETEQRRRIAQLFELNQLQDNQNNLLNEIKNKQNADGGFSWFGGGKSNIYITQNVLTRFGHLQRLGISIDQAKYMLRNAERFAAKTQVERYNKYLKDKKSYSVSKIDVYWLYSRTFFSNENSKAIDEVESYIQTQLKKEWTRFNPYLQAMIGIYFESENINDKAQLVYASLKDRAKKNTKLGMYWMENSGYYWYQNNIASQAMIISFFQTMNAPEKMMDNMRLWLILNKESNAWETGAATAEAVYAILSSGKDYLTTSEKATIKVGEKQFVYSSSTADNEIEVEWTPGLGQVKNKWTGEEISSDLGVVEIERSAEGPAVLNLYWQYTDELSKIKSSQNKSMQIEKTYRKIVPGAKDEKGIVDSTFKVGDKIEIELIVTVDRDLEFVHIKDLRPAGFEPAMSTSGYKFDKGLSYYQSPKDVSMDYFVDNLPKGRYKFTYIVYATHSGSFNSGVAEVQCHYAPKFSGNSGVIGVKIGR